MFPIPYPHIGKTRQAAKGGFAFCQEVKSLLSFTRRSGMRATGLKLSGLFCLVSVSLAIAISDRAVAEPIEKQKIITALTVDLNGDGAQDLVMIAETEPGDPFDVHFFLRDKSHNYLKPVEVVREQVTGEWNGYDRPGYENSDTEPELQALPNGSLLLKIPSLPFGPTRTDQVLTIAYRDGKFVVAGYAFTYWDYQPDPNSGTDEMKYETDALQIRCDYNVLTGKGKSLARNKQGRLEERPLSLPGQVIAFRDWQFSTASDACRFTE